MPPHPNLSSEETTKETTTETPAPEKTPAPDGSFFVSSFSDDSTKGTGKDLHRKFARVWQQIHGAAARCPAPRFESDVAQWTELVENHEHNLLLEAFKTWATEQAEQGITEKYPISKFFPVAQRYMRKIEPLKTAGVKEKLEKEMMDEVTRRAMEENERLFGTKKPAGIITQIGPGKTVDDF